MLDYIKFDKSKSDKLVHLLTTEHWPFHGQERPLAQSIQTSILNGYYTEEGNQTFLILNEQELIGMIRIFDLEDPTCLFDIRLKEKYRGKGYGRSIVIWLTDYVFTTFPEIIRIEGHTRNDNLAMRKTFHNSGYVKEAYHRNGWPQGEKIYDSVGYAMLRSDWENKTITPINDTIPF